jgi:hypothetical protein
VQEHDRLSDCQAITAQISKLGGEDGAKVAQDVGSASV